MTTIVVNVKGSSIDLYADHMVSHGSGFGFNTRKVIDIKIGTRNIYVAFSGEYSFFPSGIKIRQRIFDAVMDYKGEKTKEGEYVAEQVFQALQSSNLDSGLFEEKRRLCDSPLGCVIITDGYAGYNVFGADAPLRFREGISAFGAGSDFIYGWVDCLHYNLEDEFDPAPMYKALAAKGYGTSSTFDHYTVRGVG